MNLGLWLDNLLAYSLQIAALAAAGTVLPMVLKLAIQAFCFTIGKLSS
jgi:hypothetical protein